MTRNSSGCVYLAKSSSERFVGLGVSQLSLFFVFHVFSPDSRRALPTYKAPQLFVTCVVV